MLGSYLPIIAPDLSIILPRFSLYIFPVILKRSAESLFGQKVLGIKQLIVISKVDKYKKQNSHSEIISEWLFIVYKTIRIKMEI